MSYLSVSGNHNTSRTYLPHVDGLRALAVLGVLLYHLDLAFIPGGFVGVDVFFVISGYLITWHIREAVDNGTFRFLDFYGRRIRRLFPALLCTIAATLIAGYFVLSPSGYESLAQQSIFSILSVSNFLFWLQSGYFDTLASMKPLLHTWSLGVEEQFYLLWPLLLFLVRGKHATWIAMFILAGGSLLASHIMLLRDPSLVFFMMPFRMAEFCMGAIIYWLPACKENHNKWNGGLCAVGLAAIVAAYLSYSEDTLFPGISALLPCLGAALVIWCGANTVIGKALSFRPVLYIGLISYSIYLVHWPLITLYKYVSISPLDMTDRAIIILLTLVLASLQYLLVERVFRRKAHSDSNKTSKRFGVGVAACSLMLVSFAVVVTTSDHWGWDTNNTYLSLKDIEAGKQRRFDILKKACHRRNWDECQSSRDEEKKQILVLGDSHAPDGLNILSQAYPQYQYSSYSLGGCPPLVPDDYSLIRDGREGKAECLELNGKMLQQDNLDNFDVIVISVYYLWYKPEHLFNAYQYIASHTSAPVIVLGNYLALRKDMPELIAQSIDPRKEADAVANFALYEDELKRGEDIGYHYISKRALFCRGEEINACEIDFNGKPYSYDQHHLSFSAAAYAAKQIKKQYPVLETIFQ